MSVFAAPLVFGRTTPSFEWERSAEAAVEDVVSNVARPSWQHYALVDDHAARARRRWTYVHKRGTTIPRDLPRDSAELRLTLWHEVAHALLASGGDVAAERVSWNLLEPRLGDGAAFERAVLTILLDYAPQKKRPVAGPTVFGGFGVDDLSGVSEYLRRERISQQFIGELRDRIAHYFGTAASARLELVEDPEDESIELFAIVRLPEAITDALERLDRFDREWWLHASGQVRHRLNVDVESL